MEKEGQLRVTWVAPATPRPPAIVANCMSAPRPMAFMDVLFDDVFVNESAVPIP